MLFRSSRCRREVTRKQRQSDGTVSLEGLRFEVPSRYRQLETLHLRIARWDLRSVDLVDPHTGKELCPLFPLDKTRNAEGLRRQLDDSAAPSEAGPPRSAAQTPPLLRALMEEYAATGQPPAYIPEAEDDPPKEETP